MLDLGYPGGPLVERLAAGGDPKRFALPRPMKGRPGCDFSFSGLKTAVRHAIEALPGGKASEREAADLCAAFQQAAAEALVDRTGNAIETFQNRHGGTGTLVVAGGVAANTALRAALAALAADTGMRLIAPPQKLCTDNGAMVAWAGLERLRRGLVDGLDFAPRPRWPLDPDAPKRAFAGVKA
jgi:N6-L-threonylcarbamoyladenine synthase